MAEDLRLHRRASFVETTIGVLQASVVVRSRPGRKWCGHATGSSVASSMSISEQTFRGPAVAEQCDRATRCLSKKNAVAATSIDGMLG